MLISRVHAAVSEVQVSSAVTVGLGLSLACPGSPTENPFLGLPLNRDFCD